MTRDYELGFILNPEVNEEQIRSILERMDQIVAQYGGQVVKANQWGRRRLAYPIEHNRDGYYIFIDIILTPEAVTELERMLRVSEVVLRYMLKRRDAKVVQKEREERAEREARATAAAAEAQERLPETPAAEAEVPSEETGEVQQPAEPVPAVPALSADEEDFVPPAVETAEAVEAEA